MTTEPKDLKFPVLSSEIKTRWEAQEGINNALVDADRATFELSSTVAKSLARTQDQVKLLWIIAGSGWVSGLVALIVAVVR
jgi:hypothetical protein